MKETCFKLVLKQFVLNLRLHNFLRIFSKLEAGNDHVTGNGMPPNLEIPYHIL